jgi:hypothetical protein
LWKKKLAEGTASTQNLKNSSRNLPFGKKFWGTFEKEAFLLR